MAASGVMARRDEGERPPQEVVLGLAAAVIGQALADVAHGLPGTVSDPERARSWLGGAGADWLETLHMAASGGGGSRARRVA
jgi:hypothetical protein